MTLGEVVVFTPFGPKSPAHTSGLVFQSDRGSRNEKFAAAIYESREWADFVLLPPAR